MVEIIHEFAVRDSAQL